MQYIQLFIKLIPLIVQLVTLAEKYFTTASSGADKKAAVLAGVKAMYDGTQDVSTGGQKDTLTTLEPLVDKAIDVAANFLFPHSAEH
jgi:hypothetical protein